MVDKVPVLIVHVLLADCFRSVLGDVSPSFAARYLVETIRVILQNFKGCLFFLSFDSLFALELVDYPFHFLFVISIMNLVLCLKHIQVALGASVCLFLFFNSL